MRESVRKHGVGACVQAVGTLLRSLLSCSGDAGQMTSKSVRSMHLLPLPGVQLVRRHGHSTSQAPPPDSTSCCCFCCAVVLLLLLLLCCCCCGAVAAVLCCGAVAAVLLVRCCCCC